MENTLRKEIERQREILNDGIAYVVLCSTPLGFQSEEFYLDLEKETFKEEDILKILMITLVDKDAIVINGYHDLWNDEEQPNFSTDELYDMIDDFYNNKKHLLRENALFCNIAK